MPATNSTTNYELPIFIGTDKPSWMGDWNGAMNKIDAALTTISDEAAQAKTAADAANTAAQAAQTAVTEVQTNVTELQTTTGALNTQVNANKADIAALTAQVNALPVTAVKTIPITLFRGAPGNSVGEAYNFSYIEGDGSIIGSPIFNPNQTYQRGQVVGNFAYQTVGYCDGNPFNAPLFTPSSSDQNISIIIIGYADISVDTKYLPLFAAFDSANQKTVILLQRPGNPTQGTFNMGTFINLDNAYDTINSILITLNPIYN